MCFLIIILFVIVLVFCSFLGCCFFHKYHFEEYEKINKELDEKAKNIENMVDHFCGKTNYLIHQIDKIEAPVREYCKKITDETFAGFCLQDIEKELREIEETLKQSDEKRLEKYIENYIEKNNKELFYGELKEKFLKIFNDNFSHKIEK